MVQNPTLAISHEKKCPIETGLMNKNQRLKKNPTAVLAVLPKIANVGKQSLEPGTFESKCKKLIAFNIMVVDINNNKLKNNNKANENKCEQKQDDEYPELDWAPPMQVSMAAVKVKLLIYVFCGFVYTVCISHR